MVVWLSVPTSVSKATALRSLLVHTVCDRYSRFTWWQMPVPGTTRKLSKAPALAQERVTPCSLLFLLDMARNAALMPNVSTVTE